MLNKMIIFILSFVVFSNIINYYHFIGKLPITSVTLFIVISIYTFFLLLKNQNYNFIKMPIFIWIMFYFFIIMFWYLLPNNEYSPEELRRKILTILSYFIFTIFIFYDKDNLKTVKKAVFFATILAIFNNIYHFFNPFAFISHLNIEGAYGRSFGFYMNPTIAGGIIIVGMILTIDIIKKEYRIWYILFAFIAVFLTFSRSAILGFLLVYFLLTMKKLINFKYTVLLPIIILVSINLSLPFLQSYIENTYENTSANLFNRIAWFVSPSHHTDESQQEREFVAKEALKMFSEHPLIGKGLGTTVHWKYRVSTHNIYLTNLAELGFIGLSIFPLLIYSVIKQSKGITRNQLFVFAFFVLFIGFFSHTILDQLFSIFSYALAANMSFKSHLKLEAEKNA